MKTQRTSTTSQRLVSADAGSGWALRRKFTVPEGSIGLLFRDACFDRVLAPGVHRLSAWRARWSLQLIEIATEQPAVQSEWLALADRHPALEAHMQRWQTAEDTVCLASLDGALRAAFGPGQRGGFWRNGRDWRFDVLSVDALQRIEPAVLKRLRQAPQVVRDALSKQLMFATIEQGEQGFLVVDGEIGEALGPGVHGWWLGGARASLQVVDLRPQRMEVNGQEILTADRVALRINLSASWRAVDAVRIVRELPDVAAWLYSELQLAVRAVVGTRTLDELLTDKSSLNQGVRAVVAEAADRAGIVLESVGVKDIILPGEMKAILAQVVEAQKQAEANLIRRREETQATRSLHNTAKVMADNPTLLRLKELEALERIAPQIGQLTLFGGTEALMQQLVKLQPPERAGIEAP